MSASHERGGLHPAADPLLVETVTRLLADVCTTDEVERAEADGWSKATWDALAASGFAGVGIDEKHGGSGGTLYDLAAIVRAVGAAAAPVPLAETALLGGWLLAEAGRPLPSGPVTAIDGGEVRIAGDRLLVDATAAWARHAERIVAVVAAGDTAELVVLRPDQVEITAGANLAGEARDRVTTELALSDVERTTSPIGPDELRARGSLSRSVLAAGALGAMAQMTIDYTYARHQFGKPVATFQAVQQHLVHAAQSAVRAQMAADVAVRAAAEGRIGTEIAAARVVVDDAIVIGTRAAHQAHGAMGVTREYPLHQLTRRLWAWRHEWGTTAAWRRELGARVVDRGADRLYDLIAGAPDPG